MAEKHVLENVKDLLERTMKDRESHQVNILLAVIMNTHSIIDGALCMDREDE